MKTFGIIAEGPSDQIVIENILVGYFNDPDLSSYIRQLQPIHDATDNDTRKYGGWKQVFEYCQSDYFTGALEQNDYLIIQVDTDCCEEINYDVSRRNADGTNRTPEEIVIQVTERFKKLFAESYKDRYALFAHRILFAICVEELECWLLPLYHDGKTKAATNNCIHKLNPELDKKFGKFIDKNNKPVLHYDKFSRPFIKRKNIDSIYEDNISLKLFLDALGRVEIN